jgi:hypothetical protein
MAVDDPILPNQLAMAGDPPPTGPTGGGKLPWRLFGRPLAAPRSAQPSAPAPPPQSAVRPVTPPQLRPPAEETSGVKPVAGYGQQLMGALGKDNFMDVYNRLKSDESIGREEMVALANEFNGPVPPSMSRTKALERIFSRHRKLVDF